MSWLSKLLWFKGEAANAKPLFAKLTDMFSGRCTFFAVVFTVVGIILAFKGKLSGEYVALVGAIQALLVVHSTKEDYHERNSGDDAPPAGNP